MKTITNEQIQAVLQELQRLNVPIQSFLVVQGMFQKLPVVVPEPTVEAPEVIVEPKEPTPEVTA